MARFRLLVGQHQDSVIDPETGEKKSRTFNARDSKNNIVVSDIDLAAKFGRDKFQNLDEGLAEADAALRSQLEEKDREIASLRRKLADARGEEAPVDEDETVSSDDEYKLHEMTVPQLRTYAAQMEIDLRGIFGKAEIIAAIEAALSSEA